MATRQKFNLGANGILSNLLSKKKCIRNWKKITTIT